MTVEIETLIAVLIAAFVLARLITAVRGDHATKLQFAVDWGLLTVCAVLLLHVGS